MMNAVTFKYSAWKKIFYYIGFITLFTACGNPSPQKAQEPAVPLPPESQIEREIRLNLQLPAVGEKKVTLFKDYLNSPSGFSCAYMIEEETFITYAIPESIVEKTSYFVIADSRNPNDCPKSHYKYGSSITTDQPFEQWREQKLHQIFNHILPDEYIRLNSNIQKAFISSKTPIEFRGIRAYELKMDLLDDNGRSFQIISILSRESLFLGVIDWEYIDANLRIINSHKNIELRLPK